MEILGGLFIVLVGFISASKLFDGRRIALISVVAALAIIWNIVWAIYTDLYSTLNNPKKITEYDLSYFDRIMYRGTNTFSYTLY